MGICPDHAGQLAESDHTRQIFFSGFPDGGTQRHGEHGGQAMGFGFRSPWIGHCALCVSVCQTPGSAFGPARQRSPGFAADLRPNYPSRTRRGGRSGIHGGSSRPAAAGGTEPLRSRRPAEAPKPHPGEVGDQVQYRNSLGSSQTFGPPSGTSSEAFGLGCDEVRPNPFSGPRDRRARCAREEEAATGESSPPRTKTALRDRRLRTEISAGAAAGAWSGAENT